MSSKKSHKRQKYTEEIMRIKQLGAINKVLKKGDVENAFLNASDKDTEPIKDNAVERMLEEMNLGKNETKDMQLLDSLIKEETEPGGKRAASQARKSRIAKVQKKKPTRTAATKKKRRKR